MRIPFELVFCPSASISLKFCCTVSCKILYRFVPTSENISYTASNDIFNQEKQPWSFHCSLKIDSSKYWQLKGHLYITWKNAWKARIFAHSMVKLPFVDNYCTASHSIVCWRHFITGQHLFDDRRNFPLLLATQVSLPSHSSLQERTKAGPVHVILLCIIYAHVLASPYVYAVNTVGAQILFNVCFYHIQQNLLLWVTVTRSRGKPSAVTEGRSSRFISVALEDSCLVY